MSSGFSPAVYTPLLEQHVSPKPHKSIKRTTGILREQGVNSALSPLNLIIVSYTVEDAQALKDTAVKQSTARYKKLLCKVVQNECFT